MNLNDDVVDRCQWLGPLHQRHPGRSRSLVRHNDRLHHLPPDVWDVVIVRIPLQMSTNRTAKIDGPMTFGYGIDATDSACKINGAKQTSASHAKGPAVTMTIGCSSPLAWKKSPRRETLFDFAIRSSGAAYGFACSAAEIIVES
jgi:hypothetical protein